VLVSVAPQRTLNPVPAVKVLNAGGVVITPPAVSIVMRISDPTITGVEATVIVPAAVQVKVPLLAAGAVMFPVLPMVTAEPPQTPISVSTLAAVALFWKKRLEHEFVVEALPKVSARNPPLAIAELKEVNGVVLVP
jgi:hypothetical protein